MAIEKDKNTQNDDEKLFLEVQNKCLAMGLKIDKESFLSNRNKYLDISKKYDEAAENYLFLNHKRHQQQTKELMAEAHIPEFIAFVKARQNIMAEFHTLVSNRDINILDAADIQNFNTSSLLSKKTKNMEAERGAKEQARLKEEQRKQAKAKRQREEAERKAKEQRKQAEAKRQREEALRKAKEEKDKRREQRKERLHHNLKSAKDAVSSVWGSFQTMGKSISTWGNWPKNKIKFNVIDTPTLKKKKLEQKKNKFLRIRQLKKSEITTSRVAAASLSFVIGSYGVWKSGAFDYTADNAEKASASVIVPTETLSQEQQDALDWMTEASIDRDIDDISFPNDTLSYGLLRSSPNMPLFSKCFDECNRRLGEVNGYGITDQMFNNFKKENPALYQRYHKAFGSNKDLICERVVAKAQIFDKYDIAAFQNQDIASYMYNLVLQQNNDSTVHRVQALADGIREFYDICDKKLSGKQDKALSNLSNLSSLPVPVKDWHQVIAAVNNVVDPAEEKAMFSHIKNSVVNSYITISTPFTSKVATDKKAVLREEKQLYAYTPYIKNDVAEGDSIQKEISLPEDSYSFSSFADNSLYSALSKPIPTMSQADMINAQFEADINTFRQLHLQVYHDMYIKMQYGSKYSAFNEANVALRRHGQKGLVKGYNCAGTSIACLCIASDKLKEIRPDNYVSKAVDRIVKGLRNPHYCNTLQDDLKHIAISTLGSKEANGLYQFYPVNLLSNCSYKMRNNSNSLLYVWTVRSHNPKTGAYLYHHQACLPALNNKAPYTYAAFNGNHWETNNAKFKSSLTGKTFDIGQFVYKLAEQYKNHDMANYQINDLAKYDILSPAPGADVVDGNLFMVLSESSKKNIR